MSILSDKSPKEQLIAILGQQPDDSTYEELLREMAFSKMLERGLQDVQAGRTMSSEEARSEID